MQASVKLLVVVWFAWSLASEAQLTTGTITGTVADQSGGAVPGVTIAIKNVATGVARSTETGLRGRYEALNLPVGIYEVTASVAGFQTSIRSGVELTVGRTAVVDLVLQVGEVTQSVTVSGEVVTVETTTATVSGLVSEERVLELPLNNRDLTQLAYLQPGVIKIPRTGAAIHSGMGDVLSVGGMRGTQNQYLLDGVSNTDISGNPQGASGAYTGAETVKEFQIITNNYSAEYRSTAGAIVSAVTKSGTNSFHGSLFEFLRNDNLDANKWEENKFGQVQPEFKRNQFGGSLGGPMVRDRSFFFGSYEGLRERQRETDLIRVPDMEARAGRLPTLQASTCLAPTPVSFDSKIAPYLALFPVPGNGNVIVTDIPPRCDGTLQLSGANRKQVKEDATTGRFDHNFSGQMAGMLSGTYSFTKSYRQNLGLMAGISQGGGDRETNERHVLSIGHTSVISPTTLNQFNFGYTSSVPGRNALSDRDWTTLKFNPAVELMGSIGIGDGVSSLGFEYPSWTFGQKDYVIKDTLSLSRGNHSLRMGVDIDLRRIHHSAGSEGANGQYSFDSLRDFLRNFPNNFSVQLADDITFQERFIKQMLFGSYFQDNWQIRPSLTLNLGLRHEFLTLPNERDGKLSALVDWVRDSVTQMKMGVMFKQSTLKSFSPRVGFAWAPGNRKTSLRGGVGIYYDFPQYHHYRQHLSSTPPFATGGSVNQVDAAAKGTVLDFPNAFQTQRALLSGLPLYWGMDYDQKAASVYRWSLSVQRELGADWVVSATYTGTRALHLIIQTVPNINRWQGWPSEPANGRKFWPAISGTNYINPNWTPRLRIHAPRGNSFYQGVSIDAQKRLSRGLQLQMTYAYSKAIDEGSAVSGNDNLYGSIRSIFFWDNHMNRGLSQFDIRNNFTANFTYRVPSAQDLTGVVGVLVNGWQVNGILTLSSGFPLTVTDGGPNSVRQNRIGDNTGTRPNLIPNGDNNPVLGGPDKYYDDSQFVSSYCQGSVQCAANASDPNFAPGYYGNLGRSTLISPGLATVDFSLFKNFRVTEGTQLQIRAEMFNLFNRPNFGEPDTSPFNSNGTRDLQTGRIQNTRTPARQIQFGLKFLF
ncbi:MAG: TonB-dependent receptor [Acidobacteria bacterium]|nr:TonB-dependent receptor [Acidobacteriota bacterium]